MCYLDLLRRQVCVFLSQLYGRWFNELSSKIKETLNFRDLLSAPTCLVGYSWPSLSTCAAIPLALQARVSCASKVQLNRPGEFAGIWGLYVWQSILNTDSQKYLQGVIYPPFTEEYAMTYKLSANSHPASSFNDLPFIIKQNRSSERLNHLPKNTQSQRRRVYTEPVLPAIPPNFAKTSLSTPFA